MFPVARTPRVWVSGERAQAGLRQVCGSLGKELGLACTRTGDDSGAAIVA